MIWWQWLLIVIWIGVAVWMAVAFDKDDSEGNLAYRLTGDKFWKHVGSFFTALHWPIIVPIVVLLAVFGVRSSDL